jgi:hypothetical protein
MRRGEKTTGNETLQPPVHRRGRLVRALVGLGLVGMLSGCGIDLGHSHKNDPMENHTIRPEELPTAEELRTMEAKTEQTLKDWYATVDTRGGILRVTPADDKAFYIVNPLISTIRDARGERTAVGYVSMDYKWTGEPPVIKKPTVTFLPYRDGELGYMYMQWVRDAEATDTVQQGNGPVGLGTAALGSPTNRHNPYILLPNSRFIADGLDEGVMDVRHTSRGDIVPFAFQIYSGNQFLIKDSEIAPFIE